MNFDGEYELLLKSAAFKPKSLEEPDAWTGHIPFAYWLVMSTNPEIFVELGTHTGNSYFSFCQAIDEARLQTKAFAVDTWQGDDHAGHYDETIYQKVTQVNSRYQGFSSLIRSTFDAALGRFEDSSIGILHIDGLHTYEAVSHDFRTWLPKVKPGGIILLHDINVFRDNFGVHKLWREIENDYPSIRFLHSSGLGVIENVSVDQPTSLFSSVKETQLNQYFSAIGEKLPLILERDRLASERDRLASERDRLASERDRLASERDRLRAEVGEISKSYSWKITLPLRLLGGLFRKPSANLKMLNK